MIRVAERIRVSDESQAAPERFGIPAQRTVNREICKRTIRVVTIRIAHFIRRVPDDLPRCVSPRVGPRDKEIGRAHV